MHLPKVNFNQKKLSPFPTFIYKGKQRKICRRKLLRIESIYTYINQQRKRYKNNKIIENRKHPQIQQAIRKKDAK